MIRLHEGKALVDSRTKMGHFPHLKIFNPEYFPVAALPPFLQHVVADVQSKTQAACSSCVLAVLTTIAAAFQARTSVQVGSRPPFPISIYAIVIAASGERKSSLLTAATSSLRNFDAEERIRHKSAVQKYAEISEVFKSKLSGLRKAIASETTKGHSTTNLEENLKKLLKNQPSKPQQLRTTLEKISAHSLLRHFGEHVPCTSAITDEAAHLFSGSMSREFGLLNKLYDGTSTTATSTLGDFYIDNPRFSLGIWGQCEIVENHMNAKDSEARTSGFLARCFIIRPPAIAGLRYIQLNSEVLPTDAVTLFDDCCKEELERVSPTISATSFQNRVIRLSEKAKMIWENYYNDIEYGLANNATIRQVADLASKQADKTARIAALIHIFDDESEKISETTMLSAITISDWLFNQTTHVISPPIIDENIKNAINLHNWLQTWCKTNGRNLIRKRDLMKFGPMATRKNHMLEPALQYLVNFYRVRIGIPVGEKTLYVFLNNSF